MKKEIIIIGGGIVGATAAFYLSQKQQDVLLIDHGIGTATRAAAGIICPWMAKKRNKDWYRLVSHGAAFYPDLMKDLQAAGHEHSPYKQTGTLAFKTTGKFLDEVYDLTLKRREEAPMIGELSILDTVGIQELVPSIQTEDGALLTQGGGRVNGSQLLDQLFSSFIDQGGQLIQGEAKLLDHQSVSVNGEVYTCNHLVLAAGAWLPDLLVPLGYEVDVRPQKGQLLEIKTQFATDNWPGLMPHGEIDILPFEHGHLVIGASHEDKMGYDLTIDPAILERMKTRATTMLPDLADYEISATRVGIRAYTSNYAPFYGTLSEVPHVWVASGLGSSGLTSGPFIGWQIAQEIMGEDTQFDRQAYTPDNYIIKNGSK